MPSYISHAIMGEQLYNESIKENLFSRVNINKDEMKGYSLGPDPSYLSPIIKKDPQNYHTREFFKNTIEYIKENNLIENSHTLALLYGHIAHYFLDINTHPLIYYVEQGCLKVGSISNHNLVEGYINSYLVNKKLGKNIMEIKPKYFNQIDFNNKETSILLNTIYGKMYGDPRIMNTYRMVINLFSMLENILKSGMITYENIIQISNFKKFLERNNLTLEEITNEYNDTYTNPVTGEKHNESFIELYDKSIEMSLDAIEKVNNCLYQDKPIDTLDSIFTDLSYDTGVKCSLGKQMSFVRKRQLKR